MMSGKRQKSVRPKSQSRAEFLSLLAHELRNPLGPIRHSSTFLRMVATDEKQGHALDIIDRQVTHLAHLIDDLVDGARLERGLVTLSRQWVDIAGIARHALQAIQARVDAQALHLEARLPTGDVQMECDPVRVRQTIDNLLDNAVTYTPAGGTIELAIEVRDDRLSIRVSDNGMGIPSGSLPHVFNLFSAVRRGDQERASRLGIGLAIARSIAELHGGTLEAQSAGVGRGSTFTLTLPVTGRPGSPGSHETPVANAMPPTLRILIVEDNVDAAESLATLLTLAGHRVEQAHTARAALAVIAGFRPAVVLLDIELPDLSGYEVAECIRAQQELRDLRLVALTAYGSAEARVRAQKAGFDGYLVKPVDFGSLNDLMARLVADDGIRPADG
ncbi:ATP-binding protein [Paraburkholderia sp. CNPSo 3274]|uniref:hybrid sensor histidine kinase/response regulator n=1 Tax=Paraburkholderia sp. CNPSo 3274 TaxID=2940932 RepID=UPI0020B64D20|nr:ATP-binding protein [Paraburkholderia sp. CNPSo 3274]MCP3707182.1 ATP-binding protein [Paraburkholderia sp. CNPSo 3274]